MTIAKLLCTFAAAILIAASFAPQAWAAPDADKSADKDDDDAQEVEVKLEDLPAPVRQTLTKAADGGTIKEIEKETENGKTVYEAEVVIGGKTYEIKISESGKLISKKIDDEDEDEDDDDDDKDEDKDRDREDKKPS